MASSRSHQQRAFLDGHWTPRSELSWPGWLAQISHFPQRQALNSILGLGAEITEPGQRGHVQASMLSSQASQARKGERERRCQPRAHSTKLIASSQDGGGAEGAGLQRSGSENDGVAFNCLYSGTREVLATK